MGELVVTELNGSVPGAEWIELYNASGATIDLTGVRVTLTKLDGSSTETFVVQQGDLPALDAGAYVAVPVPDELPGGAGVDVITCGRLVDRMIYRNLPADGSLAFDGDVDPPDAVANDDEPSWCPEMDTPGERNPPCPE